MPVLGSELRAENIKKTKNLSRISTKKNWEEIKKISNFLLLDKNCPPKNFKIICVQIGLLNI